MKKEALYIVGSGGAALETACFALDTGIWEIEAFIDLCPVETTRTLRGTEYPVIQEEEFLQRKYNGVHIVIAIGNPVIRKAIAQKYEGHGDFPNIIHPSVKIFDHASVIFGRGNIVAADCVFTVNTRTGDFNYFNLGITVGHDSTIGSYNVFNSYASVSGNVKIGDCNLIGLKSSILQGIRIANNITVGISSAVVRHLLNEGTYLGVPAKKIV